MKNFICVFLTCLLGCFCNAQSQTNASNDSFNLYDEAVRVNNMWGYDTSSFEPASILPDSMIIGKWAGFVDYAINNYGGGYQKFEFSISKIENGKAYAHAVSYKVQPDMKQSSEQESEGDVVLKVKGDRLILPFFMTHPTNQSMHCPGQMVMTVYYIPSVDGYWLSGEFEETTDQKGCGTSRFYGAQLGHTYQRRPQPTLVPTASQKVVDDARRDNEALIGKRQLTGGSTPEELGREIFNAFKTNNAQAWIKCIYGNGKAINPQGAEKHFKQCRNKFAQMGLINWGTTKFSRITYEDGATLGYFKIEFLSGNEFIGIIGLQTIVEKIKEKYLMVFESGINAAYIRRENY